MGLGVKYVRSFMPFTYNLPLSFPSAPSAPLNLTFPPGGVLNDSVTLIWLPHGTPIVLSGSMRSYRLLMDLELSPQLITPP